MGANKAPKTGAKAKKIARKAPDPNKLTAKEQLFVLAYIRENFNATKAAIAAGYAEKTTAQQGSRLLQRPRVKAAVDAAKARMLDEFGVDAARTLREVARIAYSNVTDIVSWDEDGVVTWTPSADLTPDQLAAIAEFSHTVTVIPQKNGEPIEKRQSKFKQHSKLNALIELLKWHKEQAEGGTANGKPNPGREAGDPDAFARAILEELGEATPRE